MFSFTSDLEFVGCRNYYANYIYCHSGTITGPMDCETRTENSKQQNLRQIHRIRAKGNY